jgi:replicative DNA helicase
MTMGFQAGSMTVICARSGLGKTWFSMIIAYEAWKSGKNVMFISPEMSRKQIVNRFSSLQLKINYQMIREARLNEDQFDQYKRFIMGIDQVDGAGKISLFSDDFTFDIEPLKTAIVKERPDIVFIDGIYLLRTEKEKDRFKRMPIIADEIKMMAKTNKIPVLCSTQLNRAAVGVKHNEITDANISLSDAITWNADWIFFLGRDDVDKDNMSSNQGNTISLRTLKFRDGAFPVDIRLHWDFNAVNFLEYQEHKGFKPEEIF